MAAQLGQNTILLHLPVEPLEQTVKALIITGSHFSQVASLPFYKYYLAVSSRINI
jgi:hypothetical protein